MDQELNYPIEKEKDLEKDIKDIKKSMKIEVGHRVTQVYVVAIGIDDYLNRTLFIPCIECVPITQEAYDAVRDGFIISGVDFYDIGPIPISYQLEFEESSWDIDIPLPMSLIKRFLKEDQKQRLSSWKSRFDKQIYYFEMVQMLGAYDD